MEYMNDPIECPECDNEIPLGTMVCPHCGYNISAEMQEYMEELEFLNRFNEIKNSDPEVAKLFKKQQKRGKRMSISFTILCVSLLSIDFLMNTVEWLGVIAILLTPLSIICFIVTAFSNGRYRKKIRKICEQRYGLHYN